MINPFSMQDDDGILSMFLSQPSVESAQLAVMDTLILPPGPSFPRITKLLLDNVAAPGPGSIEILSRLPNLKPLTLSLNSVLDGELSSIPRFYSEMVPQA